MNTNTNNEVDYKMTPPLLPIIPKKKSKKQPRVLKKDEEDEDKAENCIKLNTPPLEPNIILKITEVKNEKDEIVKEKLLCELAVDIIEKHSPPISPIASAEEMAKWAEEDAKQVEIDDAQARARGYIPIDNEGDIRWVKKSWVNKYLTIGEELPNKVLEAEVLPVKFADASCQTDDLLESVCVKCCAPKLDRKEYHKQYNEKNKEKISEYKKKYRQENKDKINTDAKRAYQKEYDAKNKEKIMARRNVILKCECGEEVKASSLAKHKKTKTHSLKVELRIAKGEIITPVEAELDADDDA